jgi:hypothetical protein
MVWLARESEVSAATAKHPRSPKANVIRDALGLLHHSDDCLLCEIVVKPSEHPLNKVRRPTAFDGGLNMVFRSNAQREEVGRAINLANYKPELSEIVSSPLTLGPSHKLKSLGRIGKSANFSWTKLARQALEVRIDGVCSDLRA